MADDKSSKPEKLVIQTTPEKLVENSYPKSDKQKPSDKKEK